MLCSPPAPLRLGKHKRGVVGVVVVVGIANKNININKNEEGIGFR